MADRPHPRHVCWGSAHLYCVSPSRRGCTNYHMSIGGDAEQLNLSVRGPEGFCLI
ncbi:hypothetical protein GUITHDRAFT_155236, partial [Guillardia theta CCMP2712]